MRPEDLASEIVTRHREACAKKGEQPYARTHPIASDLGDCDRQMALGILHWDAKPPFPPEAVENMEHGNRTEIAVVRELEDEGWTIVEQQAPFQHIDKRGRVVLSGRMEGKIVLRGDDGARTWIPFEIKDTSQWLFERLETEEDLKRASQWTRKWYRQFQAYLVEHGFEWGVLIVCHRGRRKPIPIALDYTEGEAILARCEQTVELVELLRGSEDPDAQMNELGIAYCEDRKVCDFCPFKNTYCFPPIHNAVEGEIEIRPELAETVARHQELEEAGKEFASLDRKLGALRGKHVQAGDYLVTGEWKTIQRKPVPAKPAVPAREDRQWKRKILQTSTES